MHSGDKDQRDDSAAPSDALTPALLADLQAGLLAHETAARLRHRARTDPEVARLLHGLEQVRRDLAELGADDSSAPDVPSAVTARVAAALRSARRSTAAHSIRRSVPRLRRVQLIGAIVGLGAVAVAVVLGTAMLLDGPPPPLSAGPTAERITVSRPPKVIPLSDTQIVGLLSRRPEYGPLGDPQRRASCLSGLGYPALSEALGARPIDMAGRPAVLMVLPGDTPNKLVALAVEPNCNSADTGLLADTVVARP